MNRFVKLVNFELGRFMKIYLVLIGITIIAQVAGVFVTANAYMSRANQVIYEELVPKSQFLEQYGMMSFTDYARSIWFLGPVAMCAVTLAIYIFFIWYRDWIGKNTFAYRLLMLPTARLNVYLSKALAIFLMVLGLISIQLLLLPLESAALTWVVPDDFRADMTIEQIVNGLRFLPILYPQTFIEFILYYGMGFMVVSVLFTAILFERSYKWKGILIGALYSVLSAAVFLSPFLLMIFLQQEYLYPIEWLIVEIALGIIVTVAAIWLGNILLKKKVTV
ncbi:hypothetical protein [Virgibacillus siamensis]|uniref:hypothetical protein n=1 Tax=Virgibacillus siamensis TaxID=480071 RepID=UPI000986B2CA|nr:hypothetical protein [Virgibacillus siamensis]